MFGYVKPFTPELKVRENELYNAVYCGLCVSMGRKTRWFSRFTLSYDAVFLALVLASLSGERFVIKPGRCAFAPFRKKPVAEECEILRFAAAVSARLTYYSVLDGIRDEKGVKRLIRRAALPFCRRMERAAEKIAPFDGEYIGLCLDKLHAAEDENSPELDLCAGYFGDVLAYCFGKGAPEGKKESAALIGGLVGRFIYAADACDDLEKDEKSGSYNPLRFGEGDRADKLRAAYGAMCVWADRAAAELLLEGSVSPESDVADNIMRLGMPDTARRVSSDRAKERTENGKRSV